MKLARRIFAGFLNVAVLSVMLIGSCAVPGVAYVQSPRWFLEEVGPAGPKPNAMFFVATADTSKGPQQVQVVRFDPGKKANPDVRYHLPDGHLVHSWGKGDGASIDVTSEGQGSQLVRVFVTGDSPWSSLSEYRVIDNKVHPLKHADSAPWLLLGIPILLVLFGLLQKPIRRGIRRLVGVEPE